MDDKQFTSVLNRLARDKKLDIRRFGAPDEPRSDEIAAWVELLQSAIRAGIELSDPRWRRLTVTEQRSGPIFTLNRPHAPDPDEDFRLGLQLLMTMLGKTHED